MAGKAKPPKGSGKAKRPPARTSPEKDDSSVRDLERRLAESLEREKAAGEILRVISSSPASVQPTFEAIARAAMSLCEADIGALFRFDGQLIHSGAFHGTREETEASRRGFPQRPSHGSATARAILAATVVQIDDLSRDPDAADALRAFRAVLSVPMIRDGRPLGAITVARRVVRPFSTEHIELLKTFADQAVIAIENVRLFTETKEALDRQTATSEILRVISSSPTDAQPVFDAVAQSAARLCVARDAHVFVRHGELLRQVSHHGSIPTSPTLPLIPGTANGRAVLEGRTIHVLDMQGEGNEFPEGSEIARRLGHRTVLIVPLMREGAAIGAIAVRRTEARLFTERQLALLQTFADQAVIAIENVRLFAELQEKNRAITQAHTQVTEALEQQTATAEVLSAISGSPTDVQPVFDAIVKSAVRLCNGTFSMVQRFDGELVHLVAHHNFSPGGLSAYRQWFPRRPGDDRLIGQVVLERRVMNIPDITAEFRYVPAQREEGFRSVLNVPLLRDGASIGLIGVARREVGAFPESQVELLKTFADQAVIAIENVRLFRELEEKNRALTQAHEQVTEALEQQTATSEILRVISQSPTDVQPVFAAMAARAARLCDAFDATIFQVEDNVLRLVAHEGPLAPDPVLPIVPGTIGGRVVREGRVIHVADVQAETETYPLSSGLARARGFRTILSVPLLHGAQAIGVIAIRRPEVRPFTDRQVELVRTFADQAVIAIENVRLFKELEARTQDLTRSVGELRALNEVGQAISATLDLQAVLSTIVTRATNLSGTDAGVIYEYEEAREAFVPRASARLEAEIVETMLATPVRKGEGATGRLAEVQEPVQVPDILAAPAQSRVRDALVRTGYRALLAVPLVREGHLLGGLTVIRKVTGEFAPEVIELLRTFATQSALAIQNARLFQEIEVKSGELAAASRHKSEFLANMSHELRTPLNAIIGYSELLEEEAGDLGGGRLVPDLQKIAVAAKHQLSLINDILDLSKVEAGRMELELAPFDLPSAIDNALTLVRERAARRGIALERTIDDGVGLLRGDERKVKQVLLNLLSNALKFTPEGGRIEVRAAMRDGGVEVAVSDTGVGIAPEDQEAIFEEFRQVGTADKKVEGTGLGLALARKLIELHEGRMWVRSRLGEGATFTFTLPRGDG